MEPQNKLTNAELDRLSKLTSVVGNVKKTLCDILAGGYNSVAPGEFRSNRDLLTDRLAKLQCTVAMFAGCKDIDIGSVLEYMNEYIPQMTTDIQQQAQLTEEMLTKGTAAIEKSNVYSITDMRKKPT